MSKASNPNHHSRLAVLFGISNYEGERFSLLPSIETDITDLTNMLEKGLDEEFRYNVKVYKNNEVTQSNIEEVLKKQTQDSPINELIFYLAGHGYIKKYGNKTITYFVTYGAETSNPGIRLDDLSSLLQVVKPEKVFVVMDFCYSGELINSSAIESLNRSITSTEKLAILAAARSGEAAIAGDNKSLSFTQHFIRALNDATPDENGHIVWGQVEIKVCSSMKGSIYQRPVAHSDHFKSHIINKQPINNKLPNNTNNLPFNAQTTEKLIEIYRDKLKEQINKVRIFGEQKERELKQIFVELTIVEEYERPNEALPRDLLDRLSLEERYPFLKKPDNSNSSDKSDKKTKTIKKPEELLKQGTRVLIVGAPGAGKSVLMRYLCLQINEKHKDRLPIFIELKSITQEKFTELKQDFESLLVENTINKAKVELDDSRAAIDKYLKEQLKEGKVSIFLDGLDEVKSSTFFSKLCESINTFLKSTNQNNSLVISSRPYAIKTFDSVKEMEIAPLNPKQVKEFVNCYYPQDSAKLITQLERKEQKELTRVPLLLSILISLYHRGESVYNRLDLYKLITNHLVAVIDKERNVEHRFNINDPKGSIKLKLLKMLAFDKIFDTTTKEHSQKFIFTHEEILAKAEKIYPDSIDKASWLTEDVESTAIIREIANQTYAFTHLTIQEYLAAFHLSELANSQDLICKHYFDEVLVQLEVLPMAIGLSNNSANIYQQLRQLPESLDYINFRLRVKGFTHITEPHQHSIKPEIEVLSNQLIDLIKQIIPSQTPYINDILSAFSSCNPFYLDMFACLLIPLLSDSDSYVRYRAAYALGQIGSDKAVDSLINALSDSDSYVRYSAADALNKIKEKLGKQKTNLFSQSLINTVNSKNIAAREKAIEVAGYYTIELDLLTKLNEIILQEQSTEIKELANKALLSYKNKLNLFGIQFTG